MLLLESAASSSLRQRLSPVAVERLWTYEGYGLLIFTFVCFFPRLSHLAEYFFLALVLMAVPLVVLERERVSWATGINLPLLLFVGWVLLSVPFATDSAYSFAEWRKLSIKVLAFYWAFTVVQFQTAHTFLPRMMTVVQVATAAISIYALVEFIQRGGSVQDRTVRAGAPASDYNWLTTYLVMAIPFLAVKAASQRDVIHRIWAILVLMLAMVAQAFSYTRAGWLGLFVEGLAFGVLSRRRQVLGLLLAFTLLVGAVLFAASQLGYQRSTVDPWTLGARMGVWKLQVQEALAHPLFGVGYGSNTFMMKFATAPEASKAAGPHSTFLMVAMGSGLPALAFLVWTLAAAVRRLIELARKTPDRDIAMMIFATAIMIVGFATRNVFDYMFAGSLAYLFWVMVAASIQGDPPRVIEVPLHYTAASFSSLRGHVPQTPARNHAGHSNRSSLAQLFESLWLHRFLIWQMSKREVIGRYRGSIMGLMWSFFHPILMLAIYTFVFTVVFKARWNSDVSSGNTDYAILLFAGMIVHSFFAECVTRAPSLIVNNVNYVKKVMFPIEVLPWVTLGSALFHAGAGVSILIIFYALIHSSLNWTAVFLPGLFIPLALVAMGFSWFLASVGVFVRDVGQVMGMVVTIMLFLSPVFYPVSALPEHIRPLLYLNPLTFIIEQVRAVLILESLPDWNGFVIYGGVSVLVAWAGFVWFQKTRKGFADVL